VRFRSALIASVMTLAACATPMKTHYYVLSGGSPISPAELHGAPEYRVSIGPVTVPEALDRLQIVLSVAPDRYAISDTEVWSTPLKREIPRVIAMELGKLLSSALVAGRLQQGSQGADFQVLIDVLRFESLAGESITLDAAWSVRNRAGERLHEAHSIFTEQVKTPEIPALIAAHASALKALSGEIAASLNSLTRAGRQVKR